MTVILITILLYTIVAALAFTAHKKGLLKHGFKKGFRDYLQLLPRLLIGVIGSGFIAALLPQEMVKEWLGAEAGISGFIFATLAGLFTPGGAVVGYALGVGALKAGASKAIIVTYVTSWSLFQLQRLVMWEIPLMEPRITKIRIISSLALPFAIGAIFLWL
jgi:uncharacterized membrane protein YraQ (UPF0718 family)